MKMGSEQLWWPGGYHASRLCFREHAEICGATLESHLSPANGPDGEDLYTDTASLLSLSDKHRIIVVGGLHGAEASVGAAVQVAFLKRLARDSLPSSTGVVLIHAANPWGYAHGRRVDENNIDLNRNFLDFEKDRAITHPLYGELDKVLNPAVPLDFRSEAAFWLHAVCFIVRYKGIRALAEPIASGQCAFPKGLFYTGQQCSASSALLQSLILNAVDGVERVTVLDIHSGLGRFGIATLIANSNEVEQACMTRTFSEHFGNSVVSDQAAENAYSAQGSLSRWCESRLTGYRYTYLCIEFGTVNPLRVLSALRRENQIFHWSSSSSGSSSGSPGYGKTGGNLEAVFAPQDAFWRRKVVAEALSVIDRATIPYSKEF